MPQVWQLWQFSGYKINMISVLFVGAYLLHISTLKTNSTNTNSTWH